MNSFFHILTTLAVLVIPMIGLITAAHGSTRMLHCEARALKGKPLTKPIDFLAQRIGHDLFINSPMNPIYEKKGSYEYVYKSLQHDADHQVAYRLTARNVTLVNPSVFKVELNKRLILCTGIEQSAKLRSIPTGIQPPATTTLAKKGVKVKSQLVSRAPWTPLSLEQEESSNYKYEMHYKAFSE